jgi:hypothetical protein
VRLGGEEMAADADDGDAGHVCRRHIRVTSRLLPSGLCDGHASCPWSDPVSCSDFDPVCSFCGKKRSDANRRLIAGPAGVYICEERVNLCAAILGGDRA